MDSWEIDSVDGDRVLVDCDTCSARDRACDDCVVGLLLGPQDHLSLAPDERRALDVLAGAGLVPPLRLVRASDHPAIDRAG